MDNEKNYVWVFTAEQAWDGEVADTIVEVFKTEDAAIEFMHKFIHDGGEESIISDVEKRGWTTEHDEPTLYRSYKDGYYPTDHTECQITKCEIK